MEEVKKAKHLIDKGYKHLLSVEGGKHFTKKVQAALDLVKVAGYYDFLRTYIRKITEIDGLTQLRNADAAIWANSYAVDNPVDAASLFVQKANVMQEYLELKHYYSGEAEKRAVEKRIEFLEKLRSVSVEKKIVTECDRLLTLWRESASAY